MNRSKKLAVLLLALSLSACLFQSTPPSNSEVVVVIPYGSSTVSIARNLKEHGVIRYPRLFWFYVRLSGKQNRLQAGEYAFNPALSTGEIVERLVSGQTLRHKLTIPEGYSMKEIATLLGQLDLVNPSTFVQAGREPGFLRELGVPASSVEGFLFPSTYFFPRGEDAKDMIREMVGNYRRVFDQTLRQRAQEMSLSELQVVTLASIIEKETGAKEERPRIASVFHNRLKKGMLLQSDPTTIYGIENFNGNLTRKNLETYSPYNTYVITGLPPGPISNPGMAAIHAALYPESSRFLYFVSRNDGTHVFSETFAQHNAAVNEFQKHPRSKTARR